MRWNAHRKINAAEGATTNAKAMNERRVMVKRGQLAHADGG